jgi:uncharacterized membrane protein (UPF0127 family)
MTLINARSGQATATTVEIAETRRSRNRGLLGRDDLDASTAFVLSPCCSIHTAFMRFAIDVMFLDACGQVVRVVHGLGPWRIAVAIRARSVIEFRGGSLAGRDVRIGDRFYVLPARTEGARADDSACVPRSLRQTATHS